MIFHFLIIVFSITAPTTYVTRSSTSITTSNTNSNNKNNIVIAFSIVVQYHPVIKQQQSSTSRRNKSDFRSMIMKEMIDVIEDDMDDHIAHDDNDAENEHDLSIADEFKYMDHHDSTPCTTTTSTEMIRIRNDDKKNDDDKQYRKRLWKQRLNEYKTQVLDPSYLVPSVRGNTILAAQQYPQSTIVSGGDNDVDMSVALPFMKSERALQIVEELPATTITLAAARAATLMPGSHKHLGGAYDPTDGCIYGVPANARAVLCLYPMYDTDDTTTTDVTTSTMTCRGYSMKTIPLPDRISNCNYKWLRGILAHGYLWAIPAWADCVLCVDVDSYWGRRLNTTTSKEDIVQLLPLPKEHFASSTSNHNDSNNHMQWQWHGAGINHKRTAIYCIPSNAKHVLKVDLVTKATSLISIDGYDPKMYPNFSINTTNKWYGGITGQDNCVYGIPYRTCAVLKINCANDTATIIGPDYGNTKYNWHGGIQVKGKIYAHPSHANTVLVIDTNPKDHNTDTSCDNNYTQCTELPISRATYDTDQCNTYKWLGGSVGSDGNIYCPACDTSSILKIDVGTSTCTTFGFTGTLKNKWQGGVLGRDGCIYCIPASGIYVCRIATDPMIVGDDKPIQLLGPLSSHKDKWQGGHVGKDGCLYFIPENGYRVLKITPPLQPPQIIDGKLPDGDVVLELL